MVNRAYIGQTGDLGGKQLICDWMPLSLTTKKTVMTEDVNGDKVQVLRIGGQLQKAGVPNANGRIYPRHVLREAVEAIQQDVKERKVVGEADHPESAKLNVDRISHVVTKLWMEGDTVWGECEILPKLPCGKILQSLVESNIPIGISSRGVGDMETVMHEGEEYFQVMPGYSFVTWDMVLRPSVAGSYMTVVESQDLLKKNAKNLKAQREAALLKEVRKILKRG